MKFLYLIYKKGYVVSYIPNMIIHYYNYNYFPATTNSSTITEGDSIDGLK